jgi:hypothetical protein
MRAPGFSAELPPWPRDLFPTGLGNATHLLQARLIRSMDALGAIRDPCESRVLETALCLRLLEYTGSEPTARAIARHYLAARRDTADPLDRALVSAALDGQARSEPDVMAGFLARAPRFTSARKQALIDAFLALFGVTPPELHPAAFSPEGLHCWAVMQVTALKVITARARGGDISAADVDLLLSSQGGNGVWEGNILIYLSALNALAGLPGTGETVRHGIRKVLAHQRADGGLPFITDTDTWCTATGGVALAAAGAPRQHLHRIAGHLVSQQRADGGWAYTDTAQQTDVDDISVTVEFLHSLAPVRYQPAIQAGLGCLRRIRGDSGGFPTYVRQAPAEACMTAAAVNALGVEPTRHATAIRDGLAFLAEAQHPDGSFDPDWSASSFHTVFRAILAAGQAGPAAAQAVERMRARALDLVRDARKADGGWGWADGQPSDAISSAYALIALCSQSDPAPAIGAAEFILSCQREDGSIFATSDSIGPRPFIFRVGILADIFAMLALGHLAHRLEPESAQARVRQLVAVG